MTKDEINGVIKCSCGRFQYGVSPRIYNAMASHICKNLAGGDREQGQADAAGQEPAGQGQLRANAGADSDRSPACQRTRGCALAHQHHGRCRIQTEKMKKLGGDLQQEEVSAAEPPRASADGGGGGGAGTAAADSEAAAEKRFDPNCPRGQSYTRAQFVVAYGEAYGTEHWATCFGPRKRRRAGDGRARQQRRPQPPVAQEFVVERILRMRETVGRCPFADALSLPFRCPCAALP